MADTDPFAPGMRREVVGVELLLAEPEELGNDDALEGDLYILRDRLNGDQDAREDLRNRGKGGVGR